MLQHCSSICSMLFYLSSNSTFWQNLVFIQKILHLVFIQKHSLKVLIIAFFSIFIFEEGISTLTSAQSCIAWGLPSLVTENWCSDTQSCFQHLPWGQLCSSWGCSTPQATCSRAALGFVIEFNGGINVWLCDQRGRGKTGRFKESLPTL